MKTIFSRHSFLLLALGIVYGFQAEAKTFSNQFIEFQLPEKWECSLDGTEWVCQSTDEQKRRDAIIVLAAKIKKPGMDEIPVYKKHLEEKQNYTSVGGDSIVSEPRYVKELDISGKTWVDALHLQSEIPDFYTRYLATVEADLGILVTFSVRKDKYDEYGPDIDTLVKSLRAFRKPGALNADGGKNAVATTAVNPESVIFNSGENKKAGAMGGAGKSREDAMSVVLLLVLLAAAGGFILWRKRRK